MEYCFTDLASNIIGKIHRAQAPAITALARVGQAVDDVSKTMVTKKEFTERHNELCLMLKPYTPTPDDLPSTRTRTQDSDMLISSVVMSYADYYLPLGRISLWYGWRFREPDQHGADEESLLTGHWNFDPAPWVSYRGIEIRARLLVQFGERSKPRITPSLTVSVRVSDSHPVWECIKNGDLVGVQTHLSDGSIRVNDTQSWGGTLLWNVGRRLRIAVNSDHPDY